MMNQVVSYEIAAKAIQTACAQGKGLLVISGNTPNPMTMGWCTAGPMWGKMVFMVPVRKSRYTHTLIQDTGEFIVCLPAPSPVNITAICGSKSGRDCNKLALCGLNQIPSKALDIPSVDGGALYVECKVVGKSDMNPADYPAVADQWYKDGDMHTLFFGEIVSAYTVQ